MLTHLPTQQQLPLSLKVDNFQLYWDFNEIYIEMFHTKCYQNRINEDFKILGRALPFVMIFSLNFV